MIGSLLLAGCTSSHSSPSRSPDDASTQGSSPSAANFHVEPLETPETTLLDSSPGFIEINREANAYGAPLHLVGVRAPDALHGPVEEWTSAQAASFTTDISQLPVPAAAELEMIPSRCGAAGSVLCYVINSNERIPTGQTPSPHGAPGAPPPHEPEATAEALSTPSTANNGNDRVSNHAKAWLVDFATGATFDSLDLLSPQGRNKLESMLASQLESEDRLDPSMAEQQPDAPIPTTSPISEGSSPTPEVDSSLLDAVFLNSDGSITALVSQSALSDTTNNVGSFRVSGSDADAVATLLSPEGIGLRTVLMSKAAPVPIPEVPVDCERFSCVALTFDDGPGPYTATLLNTLAEKKVKATFFVVGRSAANDPDMVAREAAEGHVVANHSWSHPSFPGLSRGAMNAELNQTDQAIEAAGLPRPNLMRPPYGAFNPAVLSVLGEHGQAAVLWSVDTMDWRNRDVSENIRAAVDDTQPGAIILMHDIHPESVEAVPAIIDQLEAKGYVFVTVPELFGGDLSPYAGHSITSQHSVH